MLEVQESKRERTGERKAQIPTTVAWKIVDLNHECLELREGAEDSGEMSRSLFSSLRESGGEWSN